MRSPIVNTILALSALAALASAHPTGDAANTKILSHDSLTDDFKNATLVARSRPTSRHDLECRPDGWYDGKKGDLERAVEYIRNERPKGKKDKVPNLPGESGQTAACVGHTKIKWLNDNKGEFELPSWDNVADGAEVIKHYCKEGKGVAGELNHGDHWRVQVYWEDCYMQPGSDW